MWKTICGGIFIPTHISPSIYQCTMYWYTPIIHQKIRRALPMEKHVDFTHGKPCGFLTKGKHCPSFVTVVSVSLRFVHTRSIFFCINLYLFTFFNIKRLHSSSHSLMSLRFCAMHCTFDCKGNHFFRFLANRSTCVCAKSYIFSFSTCTFPLFGVRVCLFTFF